LIRLTEIKLLKHATQQRWANLKSNLGAKSQHFRQKDLNLYAKSQIKSQITPRNHKSFQPKSQIKSNHNCNRILNSEVLLAKTHGNQILQKNNLKNIQSADNFCSM